MDNDKRKAIAALVAAHGMKLQQAFTRTEPREFRVYDEEHTVLRNRLLLED